MMVLHSKQCLTVNSFGCKESKHILPPKNKKKKEKENHNRKELHTMHSGIWVILFSPFFTYKRVKSHKFPNSYMDRQIRYAVFLMGQGQNFNFKLTKLTQFF